MECYLLSEPKVRGCRKCMLSLWLNKGMLWVSEQRPVDQANNFHRNCWITELENEDDSLLKMIVTRKKKEIMMIQVVT